MDTQPANRIWLPTQPRHYTTREKIPLSRHLLKTGTRWPETCWATYKEQLIRRNKYNTKWHLVGFLFHTCFLFNPPLTLLKPLTCCTKPPSHNHEILLLTDTPHSKAIQAIFGAKKNVQCVRNSRPCVKILHILMTHMGYFLLIAAGGNAFLPLKAGIIAEDCNWATLQVRFVT